MRGWARPWVHLGSQEQQPTGAGALQHSSGPDWALGPKLQQVLGAMGVGGGCCWGASGPLRVAGTHRTWTSGCLRSHKWLKQGLQALTYQVCCHEAELLRCQESGEGFKSVAFILENQVIFQALFKFSWIGNGHRKSFFYPFFSFQPALSMVQRRQVLRESIFILITSLFTDIGIETEWGAEPRAPVSSCSCHSVPAYTHVSTSKDHVMLYFRQQLPTVGCFLKLLLGER